MAAFRAPADEPATSWIESPRSANNATAPASYAPLAPPPERISAVGASRPRGDGVHTARAAGGDHAIVRSSGTPSHAFTGRARSDDAAGQRRRRSAARQIATVAGLLLELARRVQHHLAAHERHPRL